jgi:hypothetical protein
VRSTHAIPLTILNRVKTTPSREGVSCHDASENGQPNDTEPPARNVANKVDLLLLVVVRPEADTAQYERPIERAACVGMVSGESRVVLKHQDLELGKLLQERHMLARLVLNDNRPIAEVVATCAVNDRLNILQISSSLRSVTHYHR